MIKEQYVSFETAKLLKEKRFDVETLTKYVGNGEATESWYDDYREKVLYFTWKEGHFFGLDDSKHEIEGDTISAPTQQMAMRWLREVHHLFIGINTVVDSNKVWGYEAFVQGQTIPIPSCLQCDWFSTYEEAVETSIKYCLENLI